MREETKFDYHMRREREERDAAMFAEIGPCRDAHEEMADLHGQVARATRSAGGKAAHPASAELAGGE